MIKKLINKNQLLNFVYMLIFIILLTYFVETIARGSFYESFEFLKQHFKTYTYNTLVVLLTFSPTFLLKRKIFARSFIAFLWLLAAVTNNILMNLRGTPLTGADFGMIKNGLELSKQYLSLSSIIIIVLSIISIIILLIILFKKAPKSKVRYKIAFPTTLIFILLFSTLTNFALKNGVISRNYWDIIGGYNSFGFPYSLLNSIVNTGISKPENYSKSQINNIVDNFKAKDEISNPPSEIKPNIIFVQLESFIDPFWIKNIEYNKDPIPNFRRLTENYSSGLLSIPSLGGGTANTEFEVLTGMSTDFFGAGEFPFNTILSTKRAPSAADYFMDLGYTTHALHNHEGTFYNRYKVYKNLGFDTFTPIEYMNVSEHTKTGWAKDSILTTEINSLLTSTEGPDFIYTVSVQGHGSYPNELIENAPIKIISEFDDESTYSLEYYVNQLYEMDKFISDLIKMTSSLNEPSVLVFYGDHLPSLGLTKSSLSTNSLMVTPYVIWDNMDLPQIDIDLEAYEILASLLDKLQYPSTILNNLHISEINGEDKSTVLNLLQYDILYGKNYSNYYNAISDNPNYKIGTKEIVIDEIIPNDDIVIVKGNNFTKFSKVLIKNKVVDTQFIDTSTLSISKSDFIDNSSIEVKQVSYSGFIYNN